jgi:RNA polymerase sigma factor (TIGR02999 family)
MQTNDSFEEGTDGKPDSGQVTQLLRAMRQGDPHAADTLLPMVYKELHRLASSYMRRERPEHTLQATALIHEAYLRLAHEDVDWKNREHFIGVAAHVMRRVLVDYARAHTAEMRGGGAQRVELMDGMAISADRLDEMLVVDEALGRLAIQNQRQAKVVELRYFGGLSIEQIGSLLGIAPRSVRLWLFQELKSSRRPVD